MSEGLNNKSKHGGARPGAGRKPGKMEAATVERMRAIERYKEQVREIAPQLFEVQKQLALKGDKYVIDSMLDRAFGKAEASVDVTSGGEPINFVNSVPRPK